MWTHYSERFLSKDTIPGDIVATGARIPGDTVAAVAPVSPGIVSLNKDWYE
jgi:hypothetical protein